MSAARHLPPELAELARRARTMTSRAYAPYSKFNVGAAVRSRRGFVYTGCNVENAAYGLALCAERNAIAAAVAAEGARLRLAAVAVFGRGRTACPPCGACRQVIAEFADAATPVVYAAPGGAPVLTTVGALLPHAFRLRPGR